jgi:hypothetical protein
MRSRLRELRSVFRGTPSEEFERWANADEAEVPPELIVYGREDLENTRGRNVPQHSQIVSNPDELREQLILQRDCPRDLLISDRLPADHGLDRLLCFEDQNLGGKVHLRELRIRSGTNRYKDLNLCNIAIKKLILPRELTGRVRIVECWVEVLHLTESNIHREIICSDIAHIGLHHPVLKDWLIRDSSIGSVDMSAEAQIGDVRFYNLKTPRGRSWYRKRPSSPDKWHQVKRILARGGNEWAARIFHATEMSIRSREDASNMVAEIGRFYEEACDYGNSISKPILWLLFWFVLSLLVYLAFDVNSPSVVPDVTVCVGWMECLCGEGGWARFGRVLYLAAQPVLNPLAGVMGASVVIPGLPAYMYSIFHRNLRVKQRVFPHRRFRSFRRNS